jgi:hypothetical protein
VALTVLVGEALPRIEGVNDAVAHCVAEVLGVEVEKDEGDKEALGESVGEAVLQRVPDVEEEGEEGGDALVVGDGVPIMEGVGVDVAQWETLREKDGKELGEASGVPDAPEEEGKAEVDAEGEGVEVKVAGAVVAMGECDSVSAFEAVAKFVVGAGVAVREFPGLPESETEPLEVRLMEADAVGVSNCVALFAAVAVAMGV